MTWHVTGHCRFNLSGSAIKLITVIISSAVRKGYKSPPPASSQAHTSRDSFFMCTDVCVLMCVYRCDVMTAKTCSNLPWKSTSTTGIKNIITSLPLWIEIRPADSFEHWLVIYFIFILIIFNPKKWVIAALNINVKYKSLWYLMYFIIFIITYNIYIMTRILIIFII